MLTTNEASLLDRMFTGQWAIFKTLAGFLPTDAVASMGTYLRNLVAAPREIAFGSDVSSATTVTPTAAANRVTGTTEIVNITAPTSDGVGRVWTVIPTGVFTWTNAGNIVLGGTAVVGKTLEFTWNPNTSKWAPSYIA